jgi:hypothetical protein
MGKSGLYPQIITEVRFSTFSTTKSDNSGHSTFETGQIWLWTVSKVVLYFFKKILVRSKKSKLIHFRSKRI